MRLIRCVVLSVLAGAAASTSNGQFVEPDIEVIYTVGGTQANEQFGLAPAAIGDINGDGITEIVCVPRGYTNPSGTLSRCVLIDGATGNTIRAHASPSSSIVFLRASETGDINNDGVPDYAAGGWTTGVPGTVMVFSGADGSVLHTLTGLTNNDQFGLGLAPLDDINGDGHADLLVGAPFHRPASIPTGRVTVFSGADGSELWAIDSSQAHDAFGQSCFAIDDRNGDGIRDIAAGAPQMRSSFQNTGPGFVRLLSGVDGSELGAPLVSPSSTSVDFGSWIPTPVIDLDGDGINEIVVSDQGDAALGFQTGKAIVFDGADLSVMHEFTGSSALQGLGATANAGDLDGDGLDDLIVTCWRSPNGAPGWTGKMMVVRGTDGTTLGTITGNNPGAIFGGWGLEMGDVDGDGTSDFFVNAPSYSDAQPMSGRFWIISGCTFAWCCTADTNNDGALTPTDFTAWIAAFNAMAPECDQNDDGMCTSTDFTAWIINFTKGCS